MDVLVVVLCSLGLAFCSFRLGVLLQKEKTKKEVEDYEAKHKLMVSKVKTLKKQMEKIRKDRDRYKNYVPWKYR